MSASPPQPQLVRWPTEEEATGRLAFTSAVSGTFALPDDLAPLAAAAGRTPLHYEMLELMRHATPSEATLDDVGHVLDAVRTRLWLPLCCCAAGYACLLGQRCPCWAVFLPVNFGVNPGCFSVLDGQHGRLQSHH